MTCRTVGRSILVPSGKMQKSLGRLSLSVETYDGIVHHTRLGLVDPYFRHWDNFIKDRHLTRSLEQNASAATSVNGT